MSRSLRIFLCCQQSRRAHAVPAYGFWREHFRAGMAEAGHSPIEAEACDWAEGLTHGDSDEAARWRERTWSAAIAFIRREHARRPIDLFLGYLFPRQVLPAALAEIRALGIPCVNFFCDNVREFRHVPVEFRPFDLHWVPEYKARDLYSRAGLPWLHAPMPCWVPPTQRNVPERETLPVTFVGTRDLPRERLFADAIACGLQVELRGTGWAPSPAPSVAPSRARQPAQLARRQIAYARQHGWTALGRKLLGSGRPAEGGTFDFAPYARPAPAGADYWSTLRECRVCLGVNRYSTPRLPANRTDTYSRLRDIEAPMAGACYLTEWTEGLDELYEIGVEIEAYRDAAELVDKAGALVAEPTRRKRLRAAGQRRALIEHNIPRTLARIAERLGLPS